MNYILAAFPPILSRSNPHPIYKGLSGLKTAKLIGKLIEKANLGYVSISMVSDRKNLAPYVKGLGVGLCEATQGDLQVIQSPLVCTHAKQYQQPFQHTTTSAAIPQHRQPNGDNRCMGVCGLCVYVYSMCITPILPMYVYIGCVFWGFIYIRFLAVSGVLF